MCIAYKSDIPLDDVKVCTYNANKQKAIKILGILDSGSMDLENDIRDILNGNKVKAFFDCIYSYETNKTTVCIDGHANSHANGPSDQVCENPHEGNCRRGLVMQPASISSRSA